MPSPTEKEHMGTCPSTLLIFFCFSNRPTVRLGQRERWSGEGQHRMEQRRSRTRERAGSPSLLSFQGVGDGGLSSWTRFERKDELWDRKTAPDATTGMPGQSLAGDPFSPQPLTPFSGTFRHVHARSCTSPYFADHVTPVSGHDRLTGFPAHPPSVLRPRTKGQHEAPVFHLCPSRPARNTDTVHRTRGDKQSGRNLSEWPCP
jgi:hypothetical protein